MSYFHKILQDVLSSTTNSSTANLNAGATFTGTSASTLGVAGIQVSLKTDQNCTVYIEQSPEGTNWDIVDSYDYYYSIDNFGVTVQAVNSYVRIRVINNGASATTYFRLQTALCPIVEALPRSLSSSGNLKTKIASIEDEYGFEVENTPMGEMRTIEPVRLVGTSFEGTTIDPNFWITASTGTGASIAQGGSQLTLTSGTGASTTTAYSTRRARYIGGAGMRYRAVLQQDTGTANNIRNWGMGWGATMPTVTDGAWFQISTTTFSIIVMKGNSATTVSSGSFNGVLGAVYTPDATALTYEIYWTNSKVYFVIGGKVLHTVSASSTTWSNTMSFHAFMSSINSGTATSRVMNVRTATIYRLGKLESSTIWKHLTAATATILKYGQGRLHKIVFNTFGNGATVSIYDALTATNAIAIIAPPNNVDAPTKDYNLDFYTGLTITITGTVDITVIYE